MKTQLTTTFKSYLKSLNLKPVRTFETKAGLIATVTNATKPNAANFSTVAYAEKANQAHRVFISAKDYNKYFQA